MWQCWLDEYVWSIWYVATPETWTYKYIIKNIQKDVAEYVVAKSEACLCSYYL